MNNFNMSSSGVNVEVNIIWSTMNSQILFDESIVNIGDRKFLYTGCNNLSNDYQMFKDVLVDDTRHNKIMMIKSMVKNACYVYSDFKGDDFQTVLDEFIVNNDGLYINDVDDLIAFMDDYKITYKRGYSSVDITGYSQGDFARVYVNDADYLETFGAPVNLDSLKTECEHLFYDAPLYGEIVVDDNTIYITEIVSDIYEYDKDDILESLNKRDDLSITALVEIEKLLPESIDYN